MLNYFKYFLLLSSLSLINLPVNAQLSDKINKILNATCLDDKKTSVSIVSIPTGKQVYSYNTLKPLLPASVMKIVTTAAALHYLGPEYRFQTKVLYTGKRNKNIIQGDLIMRGGGDPRFSTETLWHIATQIKDSGINEITGDLVIDSHFFDSYDRAPAWEVKRTQKAYDAKLGALSLNFNAIAVHALPGNKAGEKLNVWLEPAPAYIKLINKTKTVKRGKNTVWASRRESEEVLGQINMLVKGKLSINSQEKIIRLNVDNPARYAIETLRLLLQKAGIKIQGTTKIALSPTNGKEIYSHLSEPLTLILKELNTFSNNFTAEQVIKTIAAERFGTPGSHAEGLKLVMDFLRILNVDERGVVIVDGSGLSRKNLMTTKAITGLLAAMYSRFDSGPDFITALRVLGTNGINSKRLSNSPAKGQIRAKTGTLRKVSTLAGYVANHEGKVFGYALFLNNNRCGYWKADKIEDKIVTAIYELGNDGSSTSP
ncbi:D-alanyl-D-alanine carboxypeptidase/D-alanyl-D-alanine-endopeptidase [Candidatus Halobeggiatoa sp. HSG11]|nr:D-alanyl-D-alanine carboxypeptidase/D-alanyl-D-alanine-endopeptidase [Candidatus Halobeggiatoa sp. HSG11]